MMKNQLSHYYKLSLKTRKKPRNRKKINIKYKGEPLEQINTIVKFTISNSKVVKQNHEALKSEAINIIDLLHEIIPHEYFGTKCHRKLFNQIVKKILTQSSCESIYLSSLIAGYDCDMIPWLSEVKNESDRKVLLRKTNKFLLDYIVKPLIFHFFKGVRKLDDYRIEFVPRRTWSSFESKAFNSLKSKKYIEEIGEDFKDKKIRGQLKLVPKGTYVQFDQFRPILMVTPITDHEKQMYKRFNAIIRSVARLKHSQPSLFKAWRKFTVQTKDLNVFGVKLDVQDAYGNINIDKLCSLVNEIDDKHLNRSSKDIILHHIQNQIFKFRNKNYQWKHGLLQGDRLSNSLCELYMAYVDDAYFAHHKENNFFHRTVDDYIFCSTNAAAVHRFSCAVEGVHVLNENKTKTNILQNKDYEIPYCGHILNLKTKEVTTSFDFKDRYVMRHKFKIWNSKIQIPQCNVKHFISRPMNFSYNNHYFSKMKLNTIFNSQKKVLENVFDSMVFMAYKFDAVLMARKNSLNFDTVATILEDIILEYSTKIYNIMKKYKGSLYKKKITIGVLKAIGYKSFILVFKRRSMVYETLISRICEESKVVNFAHFKAKPDYFNKLPKSLCNVKLNRKAPF